MTDNRRDDDEALADRIRGSMAHYRFDRELPAPRSHGSPWRWPMLVGAVLAGAAAATVAIAVLGGLSRGPTGSTGSPMPSPVSEATADATCRADHGEVQEDWIADGETAQDVDDRLRQLPLIHQDQRAHAALFLYADDRFTIECLIARGLRGGEVNFQRFVGVREPHGGGLEYSGGGSSPESRTVTGLFYPPDLYMYGTADVRFTRVEIVLADGGVVEAWLGEGIWLAWWSDPVSSVAIRGYARDGTVTTLDEGINYLPSIEPEPEPPVAPTPWPGLPITVDQMQRFCPTEPTDVPGEWLLPGETLAQVVQRLRSLPPVMVDIRDFAASYLFADDRFVTECRLYRTASGELQRGVSRTLREDPGDGLVYSFGSARAEVPQPDGTKPADMLMVGSAAPRIERVEVVLEDGSIVPAALQEGMWLAWWNVPLASVEVRGYDAQGRPTVIPAGIAPPRPETD